ncbi:hypothetical protein MNAB215_4135 [Mycobacterium numidiamassiliense]|uniref:TrwC relaxase domain-containing protein n=1 Tax=Mycobacterium numidiamassiliense TaxID=1841861 RepID=A0A2U3PDS3_9MYCO|nr:MobF family relaxase [Mycobacterium numidiamassiliense]SPM41918.1 hypothetical protein MNAB215_4135 [Mycobacterium numidiamassiliense]
MMSLDKLSAEHGYEFLASHIDAPVTEKRCSTTPDDDNTQKEPRGQWMGRGLSALSEPTSCTPNTDFEKALWRVETGSYVSEGQIRALFESCLHPNADEIVAHLISQGVGENAAKSVVRLGRPLRVNATSIELRRRLAAAYRDHNINQGLRPSAPIDDESRAQIRNTIGHQTFIELYGRGPTDDHELRQFIARGIRGVPTSVAGYALTFSPVKSVSVLWALAPLEIAHTIELCHNQAVADALDYLQDNAALTRVGSHGATQVNTDGFLAAQFVQHGRRAEDPNLCNLVAVSNKVRAVGANGIPRWLALDGQHLYKQNVAASELYNTRIEAHLIDTLGLSFAERAATERGRRPVREITGISADLCKLLSSRRNKIKPRYDELATRFQLEHDREPTQSEEFDLSQRAAFETRGARPRPCSQAQSRSRWRSQATAHLGGQANLDAMLAEVLTKAEQQTSLITPEWIQEQATAVIETVSKSRATWQRNHVFAEAQRRVRAEGVGLDPQIAVAITDTALQDTHDIERPRSGHESP